jgi:hypothetical protein
MECVTAGEAIGDLAWRKNLAEEQEAVNGKYVHLLPAMPTGDNYLFFPAGSRAHRCPQRGRIHGPQTFFPANRHFRSGLGCHTSR